MFLDRYHQEKNLEKIEMLKQANKEAEKICKCGGDCLCKKKKNVKKGKEVKSDE